MPDIITSTRCVCRGISTTTRRDPCTKLCRKARESNLGVDHFVKAFTDQERGAFKKSVLLFTPHHLSVTSINLGGALTTEVHEVG